MDNHNLEVENLESSSGSDNNIEQLEVSIENGQNGTVNTNANYASGANKPGMEMIITQMMPEIQVLQQMPITPVSSMMPVTMGVPVMLMLMKFLMPKLKNVDKLKSGLPNDP